MKPSRKKLKKQSTVTQYLLLLSVSFRAHLGITPILPILPKTVKQPSTRAITGFMKDLRRKKILCQFGFTRDNAG